MATVKGLICAGGEATRLEELTRVTNKHLLPVGRWPMVYYPLQLLQLAGIREVLIVTGQQHAGDFIDLLGDGRVEARDGSGLLFDVDLTYKVQTRAGGIAEVVGMAEGFAAGGKLVVCLGDNVFEYAETEAIGEFVRGSLGAQLFVKEVPDPERFGVAVYGDDGRVVDIVEKPGLLDTSWERPPSADAVTGLYCYGPDVFEIIRGLEPSGRGELEITDVNRTYARRGDLAVRRVHGWWRDAGTHEALGRIGSLIEETGVNKLAAPQASSPSSPVA
jgi:glucose-1-phosphate thymidylyltransferase